MMIEAHALNHMADSLQQGADAGAAQLEQMRQSLDSLRQHWDESASAACLADISRTLDVLTGSIRQLGQLAQALRTHAGEAALTEQGLLDELSELSGERGAS